MKKKRLLYSICALSMVISTPLCEARLAHTTVRLSATRKKLLPKVLLPALAVIALAAAAGVGWRRSRSAGQSPAPSVAQAPSPVGTASLSPLELAQNARPESSTSAAPRRRGIDILSVVPSEPVSLHPGHRRRAALDLASDAAKRPTVKVKASEVDCLASLQKLPGFGKVTISDVAKSDLALKMITPDQVFFLSQLTQDALPSKFLTLMRSPLSRDVAEGIVSFVRSLGSEYNLKPLRILCFAISGGRIYCLVCRDGELLFFLKSSFLQPSVAFLGGYDTFQALHQSLCFMRLLSIYPPETLLGISA